MCAAQKGVFYENISFREIWNNTPYPTAGGVTYMNGNLALEMITWEDGCPEPWNTLTVNLTWQCEKDCAFIDTNNNGKEILIWLKKHELAASNRQELKSGFCTYPEYRFQEALLREIDPDGYEAYLQV